MIGQYLSNKNENATVPKTKKNSKLNKAFITWEQKHSHSPNMDVSRMWNMRNENAGYVPTLRMLRIRSSFTNHHGNFLWGRIYVE